MLKLGISLKNQKRSCLLSLAGVAGFHLAYAAQSRNWLLVFLPMLLFFYALVSLAWANEPTTARKSPV